MESSTSSPARLTLRTLSTPQKLLAFTILATVGFGYLAALANMFSSVAGSDGRQTVRLEDFSSVYRERGLKGLLNEISESLGRDDVVRRYHGTGAGVTRLEAALHGTMREKILENLAGDSPADDATKATAENLRLMLIEWSHLDKGLRKKAYEAGIPAKEDGSPDLAAFVEWAASPKQKKGIKLEPLVAETFKENCATCHSPTGEQQARSLPLETFDEIDVFCKEDRGMTYQQLALTTHVHLLGFSVLFAMTGFLFSLTSFPLAVRIIFTPWTLAFQMLEIACWWLAKADVVFAYGIFYLGGVVGFGLMVQIIGCLIDLLPRRQPRQEA